MRKHWRLIMLALALGVAVTGAAGCSKKDEQAAKKAAADKAAAEKKAAEDKAAADKKAADDKAAAERTEVKAKLQKDLEASERKATHFKEKAAKATGAQKKNVEAAATELGKRWDAAKASLAALDPTKADTFDAGKAKVETEIADLNKAIEGLENALKKK